MTLTRTLSIALLAGFALTLAACGGGLGGDAPSDGTILGSDFDNDPADRPPVIRVINGARSTRIRYAWAYESYTGETFFYDFSDNPIPVGFSSLPLGGLNVSQYDIYVEFVDGHRSYNGSTATSDPYNGTPIGRGLPRVNPGEDARVTMSYN
jgi:hypothetical protein